MPQHLKLSKQTVDVLKNFVTINPSIYFKKGNVLTTIDPGKNIFARYESPETFEEHDFGIYKLDRLINILSFFEDPEIVIEPNFLLVYSGKNTAKIKFSPPDVLIYPKRDEAKLKSVSIEFDLTQDHIESMLRAVALMELPEIALSSDGEFIYLKAINSKTPDEDSFTIEVVETNEDKPFTALFDKNHLKIMPAAYHVQLSAKGWAKLSNDMITYVIAMQSNSKFEFSGA